jgi:hypothetical protein
MKKMVLDADMERSEEIAEQLSEALADITADGEDLSDVMMGVLMFFNIIYSFAEVEFGLVDGKVH